MKRIVSVILLVGLLTTPVLAHQWTSRSGDFSAEAELIDVKDGNAILKKADGSQVTVPLSKLSLGDVRYISDVLKAADAGITGTKPKSSIESKSQSDAIRQPVATSTIDFSKLHYRWKKGQSYVYRVKIKSDRGYYSQYYSGDVTYNVKSVAPDEIVLGMTANMTRGDRLEPFDVFVLMDPRFGARSLIGPRGYPVRVYRGSPSKEVVVTVDPQGRVDYIKGDAQLPFLQH